MSCAEGLEESEESLGSAVVVDDGLHLTLA